MNFFPSVFIFFLIVSTISFAQEPFYKTDFETNTSSSNYFLLRVGNWIWKNQELKRAGHPIDPQIEDLWRSNIYGIDLEYRKETNAFMFLDLSLGVWYSDYSYKYFAHPMRPPTEREHSFWSVRFPLTIGVTVSPPIKSIVKPSIIGGIGFYVIYQNDHHTYQYGESLEDSESSELSIDPGGFIGIGLDIFLNESFAVSTAVKFPFITYNPQLGPQLQFGIATKL